MTNRVRLWYVPVSESEKVLDVPPMPYKSSEQEAIGRDVYEEQKAFRSRTADLPATFDRDTPGAGTVLMFINFRKVLIVIIVHMFCSTSIITYQPAACCWLIFVLLLFT